MDKKYIYATWDRYYGTDATKEYVYRIAKDGKSAKKLALGRDPQLVDGRIYYLALKSKSEDGMNYSEDTGTVMSIYSDSWNYIYFVFILQTVPELWLWFDVPDRFPGVKPDFYRCFRSWRLLLF